MVLTEKSFGPCSLSLPPQIHSVSYPPPDTNLFRHLKQKFPGIFDIFLTKKQKFTPGTSLNWPTTKFLVIDFFSKFLQGHHIISTPVQNYTSDVFPHLLFCIGNQHRRLTENLNTAVFYSFNSRFFLYVMDLLITLW